MSSGNTSFDSLGTCLVTGGAGMLGRALIDLLLQSNVEKIRQIDINPFEHEKIESFVGDIRDKSSISHLFEGVDTVFHSAAAVWNPAFSSSDYEAVNVKGTQNIIELCLEYKVKRLVFTSTMDVVVDGRKPIVNGDESLPYPSKLPKDDYSRTKILAEKMVKEANGKNGLLTCIIRPVGIYGPYDKYHLPNFIELAQKKLYPKIGKEKAKFMHVFVENVAYAHILAAHHLNQSSPVAGEAYFITDESPAENIFSFMDRFFKELGLKPKVIRIPFWLAYSLAKIIEFLKVKTVFTPFSVVQTAVNHTFISEKAAKDFDYHPIISFEMAYQKTLTWLQEVYLNSEKQKKQETLPIKEQIVIPKMNT